MAIIAADVKKLRDMTGAGMLDCKKALEETNGDFEAAVDLLRKKGVAKAAKRSGRTASDGKIEAYVSDDNSMAAMVEVNCETDFVAKNDEFQKFVSNLMNHIVANRPKDMDELMAQEIEPGKTVKDALTEAIAKTGENMQIRRFVIWDKEGTGWFQSYIHMGGKIGVLVELGCSKEETLNNDKFKELALDVALQIAAMNPVAVTPDEIPAEILEREKAIYADQARQSGKPENIIENIIKGKLNKWFEEVALNKQIFFKDPEKRSMEKYIQAIGKEIGDEGITIKRFVRYQRGEDN